MPLVPAAQRFTELGNRVIGLWYGDIAHTRSNYTIARLLNYAILSVRLCDSVSLCWMFSVGKTLRVLRVLANPILLGQ